MKQKSFQVFFEKVSAEPDNQTSRGEAFQSKQILSYFVATSTCCVLA